jgi:DNA-binding response OmpR family regulator
MKKRVLIVEDDVSFRRLLKDFLEAGSMEIFEASMLKDALHLCSSNLFHLILLDLYLGSELGLDLALAISKNHLLYGKPRIIAMSGSLGGEMVDSFKLKEEHRIDLFLKKPFDLIDLKFHIQQLFPSFKR